MCCKGEGEADQQSREEVSWQAERVERCDQEGLRSTAELGGLPRVHREVPADQHCEHSSDASAGKSAPPGASEVAVRYGTWRGERRGGVAGPSPLQRTQWESQCEWSTTVGGTGPPGDTPVCAEPCRRRAGSQLGQASMEGIAAPRAPPPELGRSGVGGLLHRPSLF